MANMQLTWYGYETAVDIIAAQCSRNRPGVYGFSPMGKFLAVAIAYRLGVPVLEDPADGMLLVEGVVRDLDIAQKFGSFDPEVWVWIDQTEQKAYNSVMTTDNGVEVWLPWEDPLIARPCSETFVAGFHD